MNTQNMARFIVSYMKVKELNETQSLSMIEWALDTAQNEWRMFNIRQTFGCIGVLIHGNITRLVGRLISSIRDSDR